MPEAVETSLSLWLANLPNDHTVSVGYPHEKHGLAGKVSNSAKVSTRSYFLSLLTIIYKLMEGDWIPEIPPTIFSLSLRPSPSLNAI